MPVRLRLPAAPDVGRRGVPIRWLKRPGDRLEPEGVLAVLGPGTELHSPGDLRGEVERLFAAEGERVINGQPLLRIRTQGEQGPGPAGPRRGRTAPNGLDEAGAPPFAGELPNRIVMEPLDRRTHRALAIVGAISVVGIAVGVLCLPLYLIFGGPALLTVGGLSLAIVASTLKYGDVSFGAAMTELDCLA